MTEINGTNRDECSSYVHMDSVTDTQELDKPETQTDEQAPSSRNRPKSVMIKRSTNEHNSCAEGRPISEYAERPVKRQVSFQMDNKHENHEGDVTKKKENSHIKRRPVIRQCSFQHSYRRHTEHDSHPKQDSPAKKKSLADMLPELMQKFKTELGCKSFILNTKMAVERRKQTELEKPKEREWMKGSDMQAFYHTWQTSDDHLKDQSVRPRTVKRIKSLPRDFRITEPVVESKKPTIKNHSSFGIVRECCSQPRLRIPTFQD